MRTQKLRWRFLLATFVATASIVLGAGNGVASTSTSLAALAPSTCTHDASNASDPMTDPWGVTRLIAAVLTWFGLAADASMLTDDVERFGDWPGVTIHDVTSMSPSEIRSVLNGPGTIIGGFCDSAACLGAFK